MEKFYNSFERLFLAQDCFEDEITDIDGYKHSGLIENVSIMLAVMAVDKNTGQPKYTINNTESQVRIECSLYNRFFHATIDAEVGVLIIPDTLKIKVFEAQNPGQTIACKVIDYMIYLENRETVFVQEPEFVRIIKQHFNKFNNEGNYYGQCTTYSYHKVTKEYPRILR